MAGMLDCERHPSLPESFLSLITPKHHHIMMLMRMPPPQRLNLEPAPFAAKLVGVCLSVPPSQKYERE
jgi:hypothetical protein